MGYINSIKTAIFIFPFIALLFTIPFILHQYHKYGSINLFRVLIVYSFILYMITIYFLVILPLPSKNEVVARPDMIKLIPFGFINDFINETSFVITDPSTYFKAIKEPCFYTVVFNIFMTIPFGMYLRYYFKCNLKKTIIISLILSLFFEITQVTGLYFIYSHPYRVFDVDDLIMNTLGGIIGYCLMGFIDNFLPTRDKIDEESLKAGEKVSGLRRITVFCLDLFLYLVIALNVYIAISKKYSLISIFIIYYLFIPILLKGQTIAEKFLNVKTLYDKHKIIKDFLRIIWLYFYYLIFPFEVMNISNRLVVKLDMQTHESILFYIIVIFVIFVYLIVNIIHLMTKHKTYYDNLFKIKYISTINKGE